MTQDKPEQNSPIKKTLGLSTKKLSLKLPSKSIPSGNFINKKKGTVVVVTKTKTLLVLEILPPSILPCRKNTNKLNQS